MVLTNSHSYYSWAERKITESRGAGEKSRITSETSLRHPSELSTRRSLPPEANTHLQLALLADIDALDALPGAGQILIDDAVRFHFFKRLSQACRVTDLPADAALHQRGRGVVVLGFWVVGAPCQTAVHADGHMGQNGLERESGNSFLLLPFYLKSFHRAQT